MSTNGFTHLITTERIVAQRYFSRVLARKRDHAVHEVGLDEGAADVALPWQALRFGLRLGRCAPRRAVAGLVGGHAAIGEDEAGHASRGEVVDWGNAEF